MYVRGKKVIITKSAFHDAARIGLMEYTIAEMIEKENPILESKRKREYLVERRRGKKIIRIRYAEHEDKIVVITVNMTTG